MGIETIGSIGSAVGSTASAVGRGASSVEQILAEAGPVVGSIGRIVNEGSVSLADLKNTMPLQLGQTNPVSEFRFDNPAKGTVSPEPLSAESAIAEANHWLKINNAVPDVIPANARLAKRAGIQLNTSSSELDPRLRGDDKKMEPAILPQVESMVAPAATPNVLEFPKPQTKAENALDTQAGSQQQVENLVKPRLERQEVEEAVVSEKVTKNEQINTVEEREIRRRKKFVVDKPVLSRRLHQVGQAIPKAVSMAEKLGYGKKIIGWILGKSLILANPEDLSQVVRPDGPDGTLSIIRATIKARNEFNSPEEVKAVVLDNRPVSLEEEGESVSDEEVWKVFQDRTVKPTNKAMEIVERRTVKKVQKLHGQSLGVNTNPPLGWTEGGQKSDKEEQNRKLAWKT